MRKLKPREGKGIAKCHTASDGQSQTLKMDIWTLGQGRLMENCMYAGSQGPILRNTSTQSVEGGGWSQDQGL